MMLLGRQLLHDSDVKNLLNFYFVVEIDLLDD